MKRVIIEVGSTCTKVDLYDGEKIEHLKTVTIQLKKNFKKENKLDENDVKQLIDLVKELKEKYVEVYTCGTSIFRNLSDKQREEFLQLFYNETEINFDIISPEKENELTVYGAVKNVKQKVAVLIGGGGSTEIAIYENGIKEMVNSPIGVIDIINKYPDLSGDLAITKLETVKEEIKKNLNLPKEKADILVLAGGTHKYFALESGISYEKNTLYYNELEPIMMDIETRKKDTLKYYEKISLDEIRSKAEDPNWWDATRAMCAFVLNIAEALEAKYIVPTDISMVYGIVEK